MSYSRRNREPTNIHPSPIPGIQVEVHDSMDGFWFRLRVHTEVTPWQSYHGFATIEHNGATYMTHSAYYSSTFFPDVVEMEVFKVTKLVKGINE